MKKLWHWLKWHLWWKWGNTTTITFAGELPRKNDLVRLYYPDGEQEVIKVLDANPKNGEVTVVRGTKSTVAKDTHNFADYCEKCNE